VELGKYFDGRPLTYDESTGTFKVGDTPASADQVRDYAAVGQVVWASPEFATWFASTFPAPVVPAPAAAIPKPTGVTAVYTGYCRECGGRSQLHDDLSCANGHPRSQIRDIKDAVTGLPYQGPLAQSQAAPFQPQVAPAGAPAGPPASLAKLTHCRNCGAKLFGRVSACSGCGFPPSTGSSFCDACGKPTLSGQVMCVECGSYLAGGAAVVGAAVGAGSAYPGSAPRAVSSGLRFSASALPKLADTPDASGLSWYYQQEFRQIYESGEQYKGRFNWAAFWFSPSWLLFRNLPLVGIIMFFASIVLTVATAGVAAFLFLGYYVYVGFRGNYLRYAAMFKGAQAFIE